MSGDVIVTQADIDCRNAIYKELTGFRVPDDVAAQSDWMDKYIAAHRTAANADVDRLVSALRRISTMRPAGDVATATNTRSLVQQMESISLNALAAFHKGQGND